MPDVRTIYDSQVPLCECGAYMNYQRFFEGATAEKFSAKCTNEKCPHYDVVVTLKRQKLEVVEP